MDYVGGAKSENGLKIVLAKRIDSSLYRVTHLDIGITDNCNAGCPQCPRTDKETFRKKDTLELGELSYQDIQKIIPPEQMASIKNISLCGSYGDPLVAKDILEIIEYFFTYNPKVFLSIATNGSMRNQSWWYKLGKILKNRDVLVTFGIDGVTQEQHEKYRKHTKLDKIFTHHDILKLYNVKTRWQYIIFDYNEKDVEIAKRMAKEKRFDVFKPFYTERKPINGNYNIPEEKKDDRTNRREEFNLDTSKVKKIDCIAQGLNQVHITAKGEVIPCCYMDTMIEGIRGIKNVIWSTGIQKTLEKNKNARDAYRLFFDNFDILDGKKHTVSGVLENLWWNNFLEDRNKTEICKYICGKCE